MFIIENKIAYKNTKRLLSEFIGIVRYHNKKYSIEEATLLNSGYIDHIKQFIIQLRKYRKDKRV